MNVSRTASVFHIREGIKDKCSLWAKCAMKLTGAKNRSVTAISFSLSSACMSGSRCALYSSNALGKLSLCRLKLSENSLASSSPELHPWPSIGVIVCAASPKSTACALIFVFVLVWKLTNDIFCCHTRFHELTHNYVKVLWQSVSVPECWHPSRRTSSIAK